MRLSAVLVLFLLPIAEVRAESESESDPRPFNAVGLELTGPGVTARRVAEKYSLILNVRVPASGYWRERTDGPDAGGGSVGPGEFDALAHYHWFRFGKSVSLHLTAGTGTDWGYFLGTGLSAYKELDARIFFFVDADIAYIGVSRKVDYMSYSVFGKDRIRFGLLMGF